MTTIAFSTAFFLALFQVYAEASPPGLTLTLEIAPTPDDGLDRRILCSVDTSETVNLKQVIDITVSLTGVLDGEMVAARLGSISIWDNVPKLADGFLSDTAGYIAADGDSLSSISFTNTVPVGVAISDVVQIECRVRGLGADNKPVVHDLITATNNNLTLTRDVRFDAVANDFSTPDGQWRGLLVCRVDRPLTLGMDHVTSLLLSSTSQSEGKEMVTEMASVNIRSNIVVLDKTLEGDGISVSGRVGTEADGSFSYIAAAWTLPDGIPENEPPLYTCAIQGTDSANASKVVNVATRLKIRRKAKPEPTDAPACSKDAVQSVTVTIDASVCEGAIQNFTERINRVENSIDTVTQKCPRVDILYQKLDFIQELLDKMQSELDNRPTGVNPLILNLLSNDRFTVSRVFRNSVYALTTEYEDFRLNDANSDCLSVGGYLVEINDQDEYDFIRAFYRPKTRSRVYTGANDYEKEGEYKFHHTEIDVPAGLWAPGQPRRENFQDCVEFTDEGLKVERCDMRGRFVCEIDSVTYNMV